MKRNLMLLIISCKAFIVFSLLFFGFVNLNAQSYDKSYKAVYMENKGGYDIIETGSYKDIIGDSLSRHIIEGFPSLGAELVQELNLAPEDTVTIIRVFSDYFPIGCCEVSIKANNKVYALYIYAYKKDDGSKYEKITFSSLFNRFPIDDVTLGYTDMIMLNVFFHWDWNDIICLLMSNPVISSITCKANRYIVSNDIIKSAVSISNIHSPTAWLMSECYDDYIPDKYLHDIRYESPDSSLNRYLDTYPLKMFYKKKTPLAP